MQFTRRFYTRKWKVSVAARNICACRESIVSNVWVCDLPSEADMIKFMGESDEYALVSLFIE